jgi:hypothetical protein
VWERRGEEGEGEEVERVARGRGGRAGPREEEEVEATEKVGEGGSTTVARRGGRRGGGLVAVEGVGVEGCNATLGLNPLAVAVEVPRMGEKTTRSSVSCAAVCVLEVGVGISSRLS